MPSVKTGMVVQREGEYDSRFPAASYSITSASMAEEHEVLMLRASES